MQKKPIFVTRPALPPLSEFIDKVATIWATGIITNNGPLHQELERKLEQYLGVEHLSLFSNGTVALLAALRALDITGEVITTPYSFVATAHAIAWSGLTPVFVDTVPGGFNIDPARIEEAITERTSAILPVHCYGYPCDVEAIAAIAQERSLRVIYDAAHAFAVSNDGQSVLNWGDLSVLSFHATKVFNTFEGGAVVCPNAELKARVDSIKNFGFQDEVTVLEVGFNGKMSEVNAAMGLAQLEHIDKYIDDRRNVWNFYSQMLEGVRGLRLPVAPNATTHNYSYYPIIVGGDYPESRDELYERLKSQGVFARRYFYPLISDMNPYRAQQLTGRAFANAANVANRVLCLPLYPDLARQDQERVVETIRKVT